MAEVKPAGSGSAEDEAKAAEIAAAKAEADQAAANAAAPAKAAPKKGHVVIGAAVVLTTEDGSERYLYRGAPVGDGFKAESIKHAVSVGLIEKQK